MGLVYRFAGCGRCVRRAGRGRIRHGRPYVLALVHMRPKPPVSGKIEPECGTRGPEDAPEMPIWRGKIHPGASRRAGSPVELECPAISHYTGRRILN